MALADSKQSAQEAAEVAIKGLPDDGEKDDGECSACGWAPSCLQRLRSFSILFLCLIMCNVTCSLVGSYHSAMVSTFEKRFEWKTMTVGFVLAANDYGYLCSVLFTAYFGGMGHRPKLLAICSLLYGLTGILYFLPYLLFGPRFETQTVFSSEIAGSASSSIPFCSSAQTANSSLPLPAGIGFVSELQSTVSFVIMMVAGVLQGVAAGPFWTVVFAMIDDMTKQWSGVFIGIYSMLRILGPIFGYQVGAVTTKVNENLGGSLAQFAGSQKSPLWIGAWWLGYLATGTVAIAASLPMFLFPPNVQLKTGGDSTQVKNPILRCLLKNSKRSEDILQQEELADPDSRKKEKNLKGMLDSMGRLSKNKIFICLLIGNIFEFTALSIPVNYNSKYMEHHFDLPQSEASSLTGVISPFGFVLGLGLSVLISFRFQMSMSSMAMYHAIAQVFGLMRYAGGLFFTCAAPQVVGLAINGSLCGSCGSCSSTTYFPVCDGNQTFYSPCVAGCETSLTSGCSCAFGGAVTRGTCEGPCYASVAGYAAMTVFFGMLQFSARTQEAVVNLRCVQPRDKALSLAASSFMWGLVSCIMPPIVGKIFDNICLIRSNNDSSKSYCQMYKKDEWRLAQHLISLVAHAIACVFFILVWVFTSQRYDRDNQKNRSDNIIDDNLEVTADPAAVPLKAEVKAE